MYARFTIKTVFLVIAVSAAGAGCSAAIDEQGSEVEGEDAVVGAAADAAESPKSCQTIRNDVVSDIKLSDGFWGNWAGCSDMCPAGSYAYMVNLRSEAPQGSGDDTSVNGISLWCYNRSTRTFTDYVESAQGNWGGWLAAANCLGGGTQPTDFENPIVGGNLILEGKQASGVDDTAANGLKFSCKKAPTTQVSAPANAVWGAPQGLKRCPAGTAVCGIHTRVEGALSSGDDTALNGVEFRCCSF